MSYWHIDGIRSGDFEASHRWGLPGVYCNVCDSTWAEIGPALPSLDLGAHPLAPKLRAHLAQRTEWVMLRDAVQPLLPPPQRAVPGLGLGPLVGHIVMPFEIGWLGGWGLVLSERLRDELAAIAPDIRTVEANLGSPATRYFELELRTHAQRVGRELQDACSTCGRPNSFEFPEGTPLLRDIPDLSLFRLTNHPQMIIAHERVYSFLRQKMGIFSTYQPVQLES